MAIVSMQKLSICANKKNRKAILEALQNLGIFIDKCVLNGMSEVRIIHGKGLGVLKKTVHEELRHHPNILEYRLGRYGEGEDGVTIAKLK